MGLPPPKLRRNLMINKDRRAWEIGVPAKNSLYWSLFLSYLLLCSDENFSELIDTLKLHKTETGKQKRHKLPDDLDFRNVKKRLGTFNPFKNRFEFFFDAMIVKIFVIFKLRLKQYANQLLPKGGEWNDDFKLKAASNWLDCKIVVFFPDEKVSSSYSSGKSFSIFLFQYKNQTHGSRTGNINVFSFAMTLQRADPLKLRALAYFLKKAKLSQEDVGRVQTLMHSSKAHGKNFLSTILQSLSSNVLPHFYESPYIAVKLSEAGFETNPAVFDPDEPSSFLHAAVKTDTRFIRILYDYASNCRFLFQNTLRDPGEAVSNGLKTIHDIFLHDRSKICLAAYSADVKERALGIQDQLSRFNKFQQNVTASVIDLKSRVGSNVRSDVQVRKEFVRNILEFYAQYFYYDGPKSGIMETHGDYLQFNEYYENLDTFTCLSFFDCIHLLKKVFQIKEKDVYASIESTFFLLMLSNKYFPAVKQSTEGSTADFKSSCSDDENVLRFVPLLYRKALEQEMKDFVNNCIECAPSSSHLKSPIKEDDLRCVLSSYPEIRDELLISRINKYLEAAVDASFSEDGMKGILVIERTLQVLGESIKPQSTEGCVVSCLLGSRIPRKIKQELVKIRNDLSHYIGSSVQGRLAIESNSEFFYHLQKELVGIAERFKIVAFTQYLRLEKTLIENCQKELTEQQLEGEILAKFTDFKMKLNDKKRLYVQYHSDCIKLSFDTIDDLLDYIEPFNSSYSKKMHTSIELDIINRILKSIEYLFKLMSEDIDEGFFRLYLQDVENIHKKYERCKKIPSLTSDVFLFLEKYREAVKIKFPLENITKPISQFPVLESFFDSLKQNDIFSSEIKSILKSVKDCYSEATKAKRDLMTYAEMDSLDSTSKECDLLKKVIISEEGLKKVRKYLETGNSKLVSLELKRKCISWDSLAKRTEQMLQNISEDGCAKSVLIKIVYQRYLKNKIYPSVELKGDMCDTLEKFLTKKLNFLLNRIESLKSILIGENDEISEAWQWGRSAAIKHHMKFLMRQRYLRETTVRASLETAFLDCLNVLHRKEFGDMYEKVNYLFTGINLRNVLSHGHSILETVGGLLDEDDLPSELINKMIELIEDYEAITTMKSLIPCSDTLEAEVFKIWIQNNAEEAFEGSIKKIKRCPRWENYLFLFPLI